MSGVPVVRAAVVDDAERIGYVHVVAWQHAYRGLMTDEFLDGLSVPARQASWREGLAQRLIDRSVLVVEDPDDGQVCGFTTVGDVRGDPPEGPEVGELWAINLEPSAWGRGIGTTLIRGAQTELSRRGHSIAVLWVVDGNVRARRFYEREGWSADGAVKEDTFGGTPVREVRYRRDLTQAPNASARD